MLLQDQGGNQAPYNYRIIYARCLNLAVHQKKFVCREWWDKLIYQRPKTERLLKLLLIRDKMTQTYDAVICLLFYRIWDIIKDSFNCRLICLYTLQFLFIRYATAYEEMEKSCMIFLKYVKEITKWTCSTSFDLQCPTQV